MRWFFSGISLYFGLTFSIDEEDGSKVYRIDPAGNCWSYRVVVLTKDNL